MKKVQCIQCLKVKWTRGEDPWTCLRCRVRNNARDNGHSYAPAVYKEKKYNEMRPFVKPPSKKDEKKAKEKFTK
jgi:hypothetical protein